MEILIENTDAKLYTLFYPNPGKQSILLLHGGPAAPEDFGPIIRFLTPHFQVIYFHQRGTGKSPCSSDDYTMARYNSDVDCIATHFGLQRFHLFGHSWGGLYAQLYAAQGTEKLQSLFLCSPASGTGWQWAETVAEVANFNRKKSSVAELLRLGKDALLGTLGSDAAYREFQTQFAMNCNKGYEVSNPVPVFTELASAQAVNGTTKALLLHPIPQQQPDLPFPVTITYGDDDIYGDSPEYVRERYPTAHVVTVPQSSHFMWLHNPERFFKVMADHYAILEP